MKKCPVCGWEIQDGGVAAVIGGKRVTVCCKEYATQAQKDAQGDAVR